MLASVVIPVYNTKPDQLEAAFLSACEQTLDPSSYEIIIIDDHSTSQDTLHLLDAIEGQSSRCANDVTVKRLAKNTGLVQVRNFGAQIAKGDFLVFLDSDDLISSDYLLKGLATMMSGEKIGWTYPNVVGFGFEQNFSRAEDFGIRRLFVYNYCATASMFRKKAWESIKGQRDKTVAGGVKWYEDWATYMSLLVKGWYGEPNRSIVFYYRKNIKSMMTRSPELALASRYVHWRTFVCRLPFMAGAKLNYMKARSGSETTTSPLDPRYFSRQALAMLLRQFLKIDTPVARVKTRYLFYAIARPKKLISELVSLRFLPNPCEQYCGLSESINYSSRSFDDIYSKLSALSPASSSVLVGHYWWRAGGAEQVLLDLCGYLTEIQDRELLDIVVLGRGENMYFSEEFSSVSLCAGILEELSTSPIGRIKALWALICIHKPAAIIIMSNPHLYCLTPLIKRYFPSVRVVDLLHCTGATGTLSWFDLSNYYKDFIDTRIVISETYKDFMCGRYGVDESKVLVVHNQVKPMRPQSQQASAKYSRMALGIPDTNLIVGFLGRLDMQKRPDEFLRLVESTQANSGISYLMGGDGELRSTVEKAASQYGNLSYVGNVKDAGGFLSLCDVVVFFSEYEGMPLVALECASLSVPIIAPDIVGFREPIANGEFGMLYRSCYDGTDHLKVKAIIENDLSKLRLLGPNGPFYVQAYHARYSARPGFDQLINSVLFGKPSIFASH